MSEEELIAEAKTLSRWERHKFMLLVGITIVISLFLTGVSLALYSSSGAEQLDLSRPGYQAVRDQVPKTDDFDGFPSTGTLDKQALDQFRELYDKKAKEATTFDSFGGQVMSDKALGIDNPATK